MRTCKGRKKLSIEEGREEGKEGGKEEDRQVGHGGKNKGTKELRTKREEGQQDRKDREERRKPGKGESKSPSTSDLLCSSDCFPSLSKASRNKEANSFTVYSILSWRKKGQLSHQVILYAPRISSEKLCVPPRT